jgi:hypothetical protein
MAAIVSNRTLLYHDKTLLYRQLVSLRQRQVNGVGAGDDLRARGGSTSLQKESVYTCLHCLLNCSLYIERKLRERHDGRWSLARRTNLV